MIKRLSLFFPIFAALSLNAVLLGWAAIKSGVPIYLAVAPFSFIVSLLILSTGLIPALIRPQASHSLIACFSIFFSFFLIIPFEVTDLPI
ncbi:MAG: hypothetical protein RIR73_266, partial [Chloroflexota bacterium]